MPMSTAQRKPRFAPSLRMVRLIGPGIAAKASAQTKPASAASRTGWVSAMSVLRLRLVFVLFDFLAPGAGNMRADKAVEQIAGEEQRQDVIQNFLLQNQQAADEQSRDDHLQKGRGRAQPQRFKARIFHFADHHRGKKYQHHRQQVAPGAEVFFFLVQRAVLSRERSGSLRGAEAVG